MTHLIRKGMTPCDYICGKQGGVRWSFITDIPEDKVLTLHSKFITMEINKKKENLTPAFPTHPGEILKDEIEYRGISQCQLAKDMGIAYSALNEILNERRPLTEKTALLFEAALGVNAEPLLKMQMWYNIQKVRKDSAFMEKLANVRRIAAVL